MGALGDVKDLRVGTRLRNLLTEAGLVEVDATMIPLPLSAWSNGMPIHSGEECRIRDIGADHVLDPRMREIGAMNRENIRKLLKTLPLYPLTQRQRMPREQFDALVAQARREADSRSLKAYFPLCVPRTKKSFGSPF